MPDKSASAEGRRRPLTIPRWVLEGWLWLTVPAVCFNFHACPIEWDACGKVVEPIEMLTLDLFPGETMALFVGLGANQTAAVLLTVAVAGLCHFLLRRFFAERVRVWVFLLIYAAALGLAVLSVLAGVALLFKTSPWPILGGMLKG